MSTEVDDKRYQAEPGSIIAGKYEVEREVGRGGMGRIVVARHLQLEERVALKFLLAPDERAEEFRARFLREAQITAKLRGGNVARTLDFGVTDRGDPFIVMEYLEGINLRELLRDSGSLPVDVAVDYAIQACTGLAEAHRLHVVHRDLKPANLFLTKHLDGGDLVKILDFGVSKLRTLAHAKADLTAAGTILGSPKYMAIEQLSQSTEVDERADVWSLGAILYHMLAGHPPFEGKSTTAVCMAIMNGVEPPSLCGARPEIPGLLERAVLRCLERDVEKRTPNVAVLARDLAEATGAEGLALAAKAVEDVLAQPASMSSSGPFQGFGRTGGFAAATGRHRAVGRSEASRSSAGSVSKGSEPFGANRSRRMLVLVVVVLMGGVVAFLWLGRDPEPNATVPSAESSRMSASAAMVVDAAVPLEDVAVDVDALEALEAGALEADAPPRVIPRPARVPVRVQTPPAATPTPPATPPATPKQTSDPFGSRY